MKNQQKTLEELKKEERSLFDTYSNRKSVKDKREHLLKMINVFDQMLALKHKKP